MYLEHSSYTMEDAKTRSFKCSKIRITKDFNKVLRRRRRRERSRAAPAGET